MASDVRSDAASCGRPTHMQSSGYWVGSFKIVRSRLPLAFRYRAFCSVFPIW